MSLSRLALWLVGIILLLAIIGIWAGAPLQGLWRWPAALLVGLIAWERFQLLSHYTIERNLEAKLGLGEVVAYTLTISNLSAKTLRIETQADYPDSIDGDCPLDYWVLPGNEAQSKPYTITPTQLGKSALGNLYLKQLGLFGLCWWTRVIDDKVAFAVEPVRLEKIVHLPGMQQLGNRNSRFQHNSGVDLLELRDYRQGDSLRSIDWKATARRGKPVIRRFGREHRLEIVVLIDCGRGSRIHCEQLDRLQHYVNIAAKLTEFAALQGDRIACIAYAQQVLGKVAMAHGISAVKNVRQLIGGLAAANETANPLTAAFEIRQMLKHRGLVVFLTEIEQPEAVSQLIQAGQLLATKHQVLIASLEDTATTNVLKEQAQRWLDPYRQFAALEYQRGRELARTQMQRNGVAIVTATAKYLDQQVLTYYHQKRDKIGNA